VRQKGRREGEKIRLKCGEKREKEAGTRKEWREERKKLVAVASWGPVLDREVSEFYGTMGVT
jgi:hypothetical protein